MPKLKTRPPEVIRGNSGMRVNIPTSGLGIITVTRDKGGPWLKPRWVAAKKAVISWSGGNGSQTPEEAQQFGEFMLWAVRVARKLNMPHPDRWTDRDLIYTLEGAVPQTHEQWLREKAAIEDESLAGPGKLFAGDHGDGAADLFLRRLEARGRDDDIVLQGRRGAG